MTDAEDRHTEQADTTWEASDRAGAADGEPDVLLDVPELRVDEISLDVEDLEARVSLQADVLQLLKLHVGVDAELGRVQLTIKGVEAKVLLKVRLDNVARILDRVLTTIDNNPRIIERLTEHVGQAVEGVGSGAGRAVGDLGASAGSAVEQVGQGAGSAVGDVGRGAGSAVEDVGEGARGAVEDVGEGAGSAAEDVGEGAETAVDEVTGGSSGDGDDGDAPPSRRDKSDAEERPRRRKSQSRSSRGRRREAG